MLINSLLLQKNKVWNVETNELIFMKDAYHIIKESFSGPINR